MTDLHYYRFNGIDWEKIDEKIKIDTDKLVMITVRNYKHYDTLYTVIACADFDKPMKMLYKIEVDTPNGEDSNKTENKIMKIVKKLMEKSPITQAELVLTERKLFAKLTEKRLQVLEKMRQQQKIEMEIKRKQNEYVRRMQNIKEFFKSRQQYVKGTYNAERVKQEVEKQKKEVEEKRKAAAAAAAAAARAEYEEDDDSVFGIFTVYRNSEIHGEYFEDDY